MGCEPQLQRLLQDLFSRIDTVSGTEGLKIVCVTLWKFTVTGNVNSDNWWKLPCYQDRRQRGTLYQTKHLHANTYACAHSVPYKRCSILENHPHIYLTINLSTLSMSLQVFQPHRPSFTAITHCTQALYTFHFFSGKLLWVSILTELCPRTPHSRSG